MSDGATAGKRTPLSDALFEALCTCILLLVAQTVSAVRPALLPSGVCGVLLALIYMGFDVSGAHYNPAVTLVFYLRSRYSLYVSLLYVVAQLCGGVCGALLSKVIVPVYSPLAPGIGYSLKQALAGEMVFTTLLCLTILVIALRKGRQPTPVFGIAIVGVIYAGMVSTVSVSGAAFNPAVAAAVAVANGGNYTYAAAVSVVNMVAAVIATVIFYAVAPEELCDVPWGRRVIKAVQRRKNAPLGDPGTESMPLLAEEPTSSS